MQDTTFYEKLLNCIDLDTRDNRGKRHVLAYILLGVVIGLLRKRDGNLSSIHRSMKNTHVKLCNKLGICIENIVSRSHLPRVLSKVNLKVFEDLVLECYGLKLSGTEKTWFAGDGKELRGSIMKGETRGEVIVQLVRHEDRGVLAQSYYSGQKESEKTCLQELVETTGVKSQKISADALHLCPNITEPIEQSGGIFLIGLKGNQKELLQDMIDFTEAFKPLKTSVTVDKGHGRLEKRQYWLFNIAEEYFEKRWSKSGFRSLIKVERGRINTKTGIESKETAYYISNGEALREHGYFEAVRNHWSIETSNHVRDVTLNEDNLRTKLEPVTKVLAGLRTLVLEMFRIWKPDNLTANLELFQDDFDVLISDLSRINFL